MSASSCKATSSSSSSSTAKPAAHKRYAASCRALGISGKRTANKVQWLNVEEHEIAKRRHIPTTSAATSTSDTHPDTENVTAGSAAMMDVDLLMSDDLSEQLYIPNQPALIQWDGIHNHLDSRCPPTPIISLASSSATANGHAAINLSFNLSPSVASTVVPGGSINRSTSTATTCPFMLATSSYTPCPTIIDMVDDGTDLPMPDKTTAGNSTNMPLATSAHVQSSTRPCSSTSSSSSSSATSHH